MILLDTNIPVGIRAFAARCASCCLARRHGSLIATHLQPCHRRTLLWSRTLFQADGSKRYIVSLETTLSEFRDRILPYDATIARLTGWLIAQREAMGRPLDTSDAMITAHGATLATRNIRDFAGLDLKLTNPFETEA